MVRPPAPSKSPEELRREAEALLRKKDADISHLAPEDIPDILHELQVYQAELEIQNEELRCAQMELAEARDLYFDLYDLAPVGYFNLDLNGVIVRANLTAAAMLCVPRNELVNRGLSRFIDQKNHARFAAFWKKALEEDSEQSCELEMIRAKAEPFHALLTGMPENSVEGKPQGLRVVIVDVTERKKNEAALAESEEKFRLAFENAPEGMALLDLKRCFLKVNPRLCEMLGYSEEEILGNSFNRFTHPDDQQGGRDRWREFVAGDISVKRAEKRYIHKNGQVVWVVVSNSAISNSQGKIKYILAHLYDITDRKQAEAEQNKLRAQLSNALEMALLGPWEYDVPSDLFTFNDQFYKMLRTTAEQVGGYTMSSAEYARRFVHPDDISVVGGEILKAIETTDPNFKRKIEHRVIYSDGIEGYISVQFFILKDSQGRTIKTYGVNQDITERKIAEKDKLLLESQLRQAQKMEAIGTLAGGIAHDFNNILAAIMGYTELALDDLQGSGPAAEKLQQVLIAGNRAVELVRQILSFSRQGAQRERFLDLATLIQETLKLLKASLPATIEIKTDLEKSNSQVLTDPVHINQVVMNLCTNAAQAMEDYPGGVLTINLSTVDLDEDAVKTFVALKVGKYFKLMVGDTGIGMTEDVIARMFEPFFTTKPRGKGTGMGLAVVHGIVERMHGEITVQSEPGKGTTVIVYLPVVEAGQVADENGKDRAAEGGIARLLLVDDEETLVELGTQILKRLGYEVTAFTSSLEALERFKAGPNDFDLVITDYTMPEMTGAKLSQEILAIRPGMPIIICTGYSQQIDDEKARALGVRKLLMKPLSRGAIAQAVREVLDQADYT